jgi:hypothetical protein
VRRTHRHGTRGRRWGTWAGVLLLGLTAGLRAGAAETGDDTAAFLQREITILTGGDPGRPDPDPEVQAKIEALRGIQTRMSGTEGCEKAADYLMARFKQIGLTRVTAHPFDVIVPVTKYCRMALGAGREAVEIYPLWPNWVRTCTTPGPIECPVVYVGQGRSRDLNGLPIRGSIVVMEHNTGAAWQWIASLGPRAFIFVEPRGREATRGHAEKKFLRDPLHMPRFWVPATGKASGAAALVRRVVEAQKRCLAERSKGADPAADKHLLRGRLDCRVDWEVRRARSILGLLEGTTATADRGNFVAYTAHYDSMSIAPDLAPGADEACSIAALLRLAEHLKANRGPENVLFIAFAGHYQALQGSTVLADATSLSSSPLPDGRLAPIRELRRYVGTALSGKTDRRSLAEAGDELTRRVKLIQGLPEETVQAPLVQLANLLIEGLGDRPSMDQMWRTLDLEKLDRRFRRPMREVLVALADQAEDGPVSAADADRALARYARYRARTLLNADPLSQRIRKLVEDEIDREGRVEEYQELIERFETAEGLAPETVEPALDNVASLRDSVEADADADDQIDRLRTLLNELGDAALLTPQARKAAGKAIDAVRKQPGQTLGAKGVEHVNAALDRLRDELKLRLRIAREGIEHAEELKRKITEDSSSQRVYDAIFRLIDVAGARELIDPSTQRDLQFKAEREMDSERHVTQHRFELLRLRRHEAFFDEFGIDLNKRLRLVYALELCSDGWRYGVFAQGANGLISQNVSEQTIYGNLIQKIWQLGRRRLSEEAAFGEEGRRFYEHIFYPARAEERLAGLTGGYFRGSPSFDSESFQLSGREALAFATVDCARRRVDTPSDTVDRIRETGGFERLATQTDLLCDTTRKMADDVQVRSFYQTLDANRAGDRSALVDHACRVFGRVVRYDPRLSMATADQPIADALCVARFTPGTWGLGVGGKTFMGVRDGYMTFTDEGGTWELLALPHDRSRAWNAKDYKFGAYRFYAGEERAEGAELVPPDLGEVVVAPDLGPQGAMMFKIEYRISKEDLEVTVPVFRCRPVGLFGFVDALLGKGFTDATLYDAGTNTTPDYYGKSIYPKSRNYTHGAPSGVLFLQPGTRFKIQFTAGALGNSVPMVNMRPGETDGETVGYGYTWPTRKVRKPKDYHVRHGTLAGCRYLMARDVFLLDDHRIAALKKHSVENNRVNELHFGKFGTPEEGEEPELEVAGSKQELAAAEEARDQRRYDRFVASLESAYAKESRAYPIIKGTTTDILTGVLFYLFLLLPFSYFAERLLFGFPDVNRRIVGFFAIFVVVFLILALVHPAFAITQSAPVILIAFITLALSLLVMSMIRSRFELEVKRLHERPGARRQGDFTRASATSAACALGIGNMRRRKVRTSLTLATLVLLTFSVLSFTSVEPRQITHENPNPTGEEIRPPYSGVLIRSPHYVAISEYLYRLARDEFSAEAAVVPRVWLGSDALIQSTEDYRTQFLCPGVVGLAPGEKHATKPQEHLVDGGRWFEEGAEPACVIGGTVAEELGITAEQIEAANAGRGPRPTLRMLGVVLPVIAVVDAERFNKLTDIDGEQLSPVDRRKESWMKRAGKTFDPYAVESYIHVEAENCVFVPHDFLLEYGANLISVAIVPLSDAADPEVASRERSRKAEEIGDDLLSRLTIPIYISSKKETAIGSVTYALSSDANRVRGMGSMIVPMLICALIVLNTMLGSVYERQREISIFGSLGLAPLHIGSLFVAESAVFATVAVIIGYVLGQTTSFVLTQFQMLEGFSLNYSSTSAVISAAAVMALVLLSTIYPARKASQLSVPDVERIWKLPEPDGDHFYIKFPFTVGGQQAYGINMFLVEYFLDHANQSVGDFFAQETRLSMENVDGNDVMRFDSQVWIAPFDFGISQSLTLYTVPTDEEGIYAPEMHLYRKSGDPAAWARMNHRFLKLIRQQFLMWRILSAEEREVFAANAKIRLGIATDEDRRMAAEAAAAHRPAEEERGEAKEPGEKSAPAKPDQPPSEET